MTVFDPRKNALRVDEKFFPAFFLGVSCLSPGARHLYIWLYWLKSARPHWKVFLADLGAVTGFSSRTIQTHLKRLEKEGFIAVRSEKNEGLRYDLLIHDAMRSMDIQFERAARRVSRPEREMKNFRGGHEKISCPLLKEVKELKKINSPLSPLPCGRASDAVGSSSQRHVGSGGILSDFEKLWETWPVKKSRAAAQELFLRLFRKGVLPSLDMMLSKISELKERDAHWRNGYVKELGNWLRAEGWNDEPFLRPDKSSSWSTAGGTPPTPAVNSKQESQDMPVLMGEPSAPMRRETILAIAAKSFCPWSKDEINAMLERADEFYQGQKKGDGKSRIFGQQAAHPGFAGERILSHHDLHGFEGQRAGNDQFRAVLALSVRDEVRSPLVSFGVPSLARAPGFGLA